MKVIKEGRPQKGWAKEFACTGKGNKDGGCGAVLLVEQGDLFQTASSCCGEVDRFITFQCSQCGVLTDIDNKDCGFHVADLPTKTDWLKSKVIESV